RIRERMTSSGFLTDINSDYRPGQAEVRLYPDRAKAAELGVSMRRLGFAMSIGQGGVRDGRLTHRTRRYDVRLRYLDGQRNSPDQLDDVYVKSDKTGKLIPLTDLVTRRVDSTLPVINRYNHLRKVELTANMAPGVSQGEAIASALRLAQDVRA